MGVLSYGVGLESAVSGAGRHTICKLFAQLLTAASSDHLSVLAHLTCVMAAQNKVGGTHPRKRLSRAKPPPQKPPARCSVRGASHRSPPPTTSSRAQAPIGLPTRMVIAALGGMGAATVCHPLDTLRVNLQVDTAGRFAGMADAAVKITKRSGVSKGYGTFRLNFHRFDRFELDLRGYTQP